MTFCMLNEHSLRILLADDHQIVLDSLAVLLDTIADVRVVGKVTNGRLALDFLGTHEVDLLITDLHMPECDGIQLCRSCKQHFPAVKVLMLTMLDDAKNIRAAIQAGAMGYILKRAGFDELKKVIEVISEGRRYFSEEIILELAEMEGEDPGALKKTKYVSFSEREREVLRWIAEEYSTPQIAEKLGLSVPTIETYRQRMAQKAGVKGAVGLVLYAMKHGLL